jgi:hypothetical protein
MIRRVQTLRFAVVIALACRGAVAFAQQPPQGPVAYVTAVTGEGATRQPDGALMAQIPDSIEPADDGARLGDRILTGPDRTSDDGTITATSAVLFMPGYGIVIHLEHETELEFFEAPVAASLCAAGIRVVRGGAYIVGRSSDDRWLLVTAGADTARGYALARGGSLLISARPGGVEYAAAHGELRYYDQPLPALAPLDETGEATAPGTVIAPNERLRSTGPAAPQPEADLAASATARLSDHVYSFGLDRGGTWIRDAERGDFTPVRLAARATLPTFETEIGIPELAFDQPRSSQVTVAPRVVTTAPQAVISPARILIASGIPSEVLAGQRYRRTIIIGNPGTTGGAIRVNPFAEPLFTLAGLFRD